MHWIRAQNGFLDIKSTCEHRKQDSRLEIPSWIWWVQEEELKRNQALQKLQQHMQPSSVTQVNVT